MDEAVSLVYKETPTGTLQAHLFYPKGHEETDTRTAIAFFSSGLWDNTVTSQFAPHCLHFRERGAVTVIFEYRELSKHSITPLEAISDGRSALRWLRMNASALGVAPNQITAAGAAGGAHLCLTAAMLDGYDEEGEPAELSCKPDAMALFSPVIDTTKKGVGFEKFADPKLAKLTSPSRNIKRGLPPSIIFQGLHDRVVPAEAAIRFAKVMARKKNQCELLSYAGEGHSFFNFNFNIQHFESTLNAMDRFLVDLQLLPVNEEDDGTNRLAS